MKSGSIFGRLQRVWWSLMGWIRISWWSDSISWLIESNGGEWCGSKCFMGCNGSNYKMKEMKKMKKKWSNKLAGVGHVNRRRHLQRCKLLIKFLPSPPVVGLLWLGWLNSSVELHLIEHWPAKTADWSLMHWTCWFEIKRFTKFDWCVSINVVNQRLIGE